MIKLKLVFLSKYTTEIGSVTELEDCHSENARKKRENSLENLDGTRKIVGDPDSIEKAKVNNELTGTLEGPTCKDRPLPTLVTSEEYW